LDEQDRQALHEGSREQPLRSTKLTRKEIRQAERAARRLVHKSTAEDSASVSVDASEPDAVRTFRSRLQQELDCVPADALTAKWRVLAKAQRRYEREQSEAALKETAWQSLAYELAGDYLTRHEEEWHAIPFKHHVRQVQPKPLRAAIRAVVNHRRDELIRSAVGAPGWSWIRDADDTSGGARFGIGMDERVVELPLAIRFARVDQPGFILDAGAALNVPVVRAATQHSAVRMVHVTQSADREPMLVEDDRYSYLFGDLRALPFDDGVFDRVVCVSSLEHVGMDNGRYGAAEELNRESWFDAVIEMLRVLKPGGEMLVTVPHGDPDLRGWYQVFGTEQIARLGRVPGIERSEVQYFQYDCGWARTAFARSREVDAETVHGHDDIVWCIAAVTLTKSTVASSSRTNSAPPQGQ